METAVSLSAFGAPIAAAAAGRGRADGEHRQEFGRGPCNGISPETCRTHRILLASAAYAHHDYLVAARVRGI